MLVKGGELPLPDPLDPCTHVHCALRKVKGGRELEKSQAWEGAQAGTQKVTVKCGLKESEEKGKDTGVRGQRKRSLTRAYLVGLLLPSNDRRPKLPSTGPWI